MITLKNQMSSQVLFPHRLHPALQKPRCLTPLSAPSSLSSSSLVLLLKNQKSFNRSREKNSADTAATEFIKQLILL